MLDELMDKLDELKDDFNDEDKLNNNFGWFEG